MNLIFNLYLFAYSLVCCERLRISDQNRLEIQKFHLCVASLNFQAQLYLLLRDQKATQFLPLVPLLTSLPTPTTMATNPQMALDPKYDDYDFPTTAPEVQSGHPGHLDEVQQAQVNQLRQLLEKEGFTERLDTLTLLRFLRARKFNVELAKQMYVG